MSFVKVCLSVSACVAYALSGFFLFEAIESYWRWVVSVPFWFVALLTLGASADSCWRGFVVFVGALVNFVLIERVVEDIASEQLVLATVWFILSLLVVFFSFGGDGSVQTIGSEGRSSSKSKPRKKPSSRRSMTREARDWASLVDRDDVLIVDTETTRLGLDCRGHRNCRFGYSRHPSSACFRSADAVHSEGGDGHPRSYRSQAEASPCPGLAYRLDGDWTHSEASQVLCCMECLVRSTSDRTVVSTFRSACGSFAGGVI